jgi:hypothetical protein
MIALENHYKVVKILHNVDHVRGVISRLGYEAPRSSNVSIGGYTYEVPHRTVDKVRELVKEDLESYLQTLYADMRSLGVEPPQ